MNICKTKEVTLFIVKSAIFLYITNAILWDIYIVQFLAFAIGEVFISSELISYLLYVICEYFSRYLYIVFLYFTAKKLGLIKFIDKSPIWAVILILIVYEIALTLSLPINISNEPLDSYLIQEWKLIISNTWEYIEFGKGFISTFFAYKIVRFLVNKYPKLSFLNKFYFLRRFENIITFKNTWNLIKFPFVKLANWWKENFRVY